MATTTHPAAHEDRVESPRPADVFVTFGITGDLARVMTFRSLYRLEKRGVLDCPIVGVAVDNWSADDLREHAHAAIAAGEPVDDAVFERFAARLSYLQGDFADADTFKRLATAIAGARQPVFYLEIPPFLFGTVVAGLAGAGLTANARVVVEKPFGHDLGSARELAEQLHQYIDESQLYRIDHFLGKMGLAEILYLRFANTTFEPIWNRSYVSSVQITMAEDFGVDDRGHFYDPVGALRDVVVNHLMHVVGAAAMEPPAGGEASILKDSLYSVFRAMREADPAHHVRGQHVGYRQIDGVAPDSQTETFAALRLVFQHPPRLNFRAQGRRPEADQLIVRLDPAAGIRMLVEAQLGEAVEPRQLPMDVELAGAGVEEPAPYEVLLHAAMRGDSARFRRQDSVEQTWRVLQPLLDAPPKVHPYAKGTWGPPAADDLIAGHGRWHEPWVPA